MAVEGAPTLTSSEDTKTDAVDAVSVSVEKGGNATADVQPGSLDKVKFIYIKLEETDLYGKVKYTFNDGTTDSDEVTLDKDHFLTSGELIKLFGVSPNQIKFTNNDADTDASVEIVVAREAT